MVDQILCRNCRRVSEVADPAAMQWDCPACKRAYVFRRCANCQAISHVGALLPSRAKWECVWCSQENAGFSQRRDPAAATVGEAAASIAERHLELPPLPEPITEAAEGPMLIVTTNEIVGYRIVRVHGDVFGLTVRVRSAWAGLANPFVGIVGGEVGSYTQLLADSRNEARRRMWREAKARGGNAVVGMRFDCNEIGNVMTEIAAYGTAVTVEAADASSPDSLGLSAPVAGLQNAGAPDGSD